MEEKVSVKMRMEGEVAVAEFEGAPMCDSVEVRAAGEKINEFIANKRPAYIVIDFSEVKFICSDVVGMLLASRNKVREYGGEVLVSGINPQWYRVFKITNVDKLFRFYENSESAVEAVRGI